MANNYKKKDNDFRYEIQENLGILSTNSRGWSKELNFVSWNGREAKYDIREWNPEHTKMGRGITLTVEEFDSLREILMGIIKDTGSNLFDVDDSEKTA